MDSCQLNWHKCSSSSCNSCRQLVGWVDFVSSNGTICFPRTFTAIFLISVDALEFFSTGRCLSGARLFSHKNKNCLLLVIQHTIEISADDADDDDYLNIHTIGIFTTILILMRITTQPYAYTIRILYTTNNNSYEQTQMHTHTYTLTHKYTTIIKKTHCHHVNNSIICIYNFYSCSFSNWCV